MDNITAQVDLAVLQQKANEFATKGALKAIEDHYTSYDSPYKKAITAALAGNGVDNWKLELPDILALINERLSSEIDAIANVAVAKTFVPMVQRFLTRNNEKEAFFSDILKMFIKTYDDIKYEGANVEDFSVIVTKNERFEWLSVEISDNERAYDFTLHIDNESKKKGEVKYKVLSLPTFNNDYSRKHYEKNKQVMKVLLDGATLELPFTRDVLADSFISQMAGYVLSNTLIRVDTTDFDEDWFPEQCHCH